MAVADKRKSCKFIALSVGFTSDSAVSTNLSLDDDSMHSHC